MPKSGKKTASMRSFPAMNNLAALFTAENAQMEALIQILPQELLEALKEAATAQKHTLDLEVTLRLLATFKDPHAFGFNPKLDEIFYKKFTDQDAEAECKRRRDGYLYLYEMQKLKHLVEFEDKLPHAYKEHFTVIDVKTAIGPLRLEKQRRQQQERD